MTKQTARKDRSPKKADHPTYQEPSILVIKLIFKRVEPFHNLRLKQECDGSLKTEEEYKLIIKNSRSCHSLCRIYENGKLNITCQYYNDVSN